MFGFGRKEKLHYVVLTDRELNVLYASMSRQERREFDRRQKNARDDAYEDGFLDGFIIGGND
ncbi:MAG: hypothetical protein IKE56_05935 [Lachnospiraceae bacterium]|nr:hypothetical protein [Lachnospiraceae bacterium]